MTKLRLQIFGFVSITFLLGMAILSGGCRGENEGPVIRLIGHDSITWPKGKPFVDPGFIAFDQQDFDLTGEVETTGNLDLLHVGYYVLIYTVKDKSGSIETAHRVVQILHSNATLEGTYNSVDNCPGCPSTGTATVTKYNQTADKIQITPSMGNVGGNNTSSIVLRIAADGQLQLVSGSTVPCNFTVIAVTGQVSDSGDSISFDFKLQHNNTPSYCSAVYTRQ